MIVNTIISTEELPPSTHTIKQVVNREYENQKQININLGESEFNRREREKREEEERKILEELARLEEIKRNNTLKHSQSRSNEQTQIIGYSSHQCVTYYKQEAGISRSLGYAGSIRPQGQEPRVGAGALWAGIGHIGIVREIRDDVIVVDDANYYRGKITRHILSKSNFRGYIYN